MAAPAAQASRKRPLKNTVPFLDFTVSLMGLAVSHSLAGGQRNVTRWRHRLLKVPGPAPINTPSQRGLA